MESNKLSEMINIGKELEKMLIGVGINTPQDLVEIGSVEATKRLKLKGVACYNKLYALEGAIRDMRWHGLSKLDKENLKEAYNKETVEN